MLLKVFKRNPRERSSWFWILLQQLDMNLMSKDISINVTESVFNLQYLDVIIRFLYAES